MASRWNSKFSEAYFTPWHTKGSALGVVFQDSLNNLKDLCRFWHLSYPSFVCRERTTSDLDSPFNLTSADASWMPGQTNGKALGIVFNGQCTTLEFSPIFSAFHINHSFARQLEHLIQIALESLHRLMQVSRRGTQKKSGAVGFHGWSMGMAGLWHFSQVSFVRRERTNNAIDSPWNSASVYVNLMPRQTKLCRQKKVFKNYTISFW